MEKFCELFILYRNGKEVIFTVPLTYAQTLEKDHRNWITNPDRQDFLFSNVTYALPGGNVFSRIIDVTEILVMSYHWNS